MFSIIRIASFMSTLLLGACLSLFLQRAFAAERLACNLIMQSDVEAIFHEKFESGGPGTNNTEISSACAYRLLGPSQLHFNLSLRKKSAAEFDVLMSVVAASGLTPLTGVGEKAYENAKTGAIFSYNKGYQLDFQILDRLTSSRKGKS